MKSVGGDGIFDRVATLRWRAVILAVALAIMAPELAAGVIDTDSLRYNLVWPAQFGELFRSGQLYPRWLPHSWDGLGSPTFYFYPPLFFWTAAIIGSVAPLEWSVSLASATVLAVSGFSMRAWLAEQGGPKAALAGAVAYMVAPYHLYDIYVRGALAEACAYAALPLVMLGIKRIGEGRTSSVVMLGIAYALLLLSHLPVALLASLTAIPAYAFYVSRSGGRPLERLGWCLAGGVLGLGMSAIYVLPALVLLPHISAEALGGPFYSPESWSFLRPAVGRDGPLLLIIPLTLGAFLLALGSAAARRNPDAAFWALVMVGLLVLIAGLVPAIWRLPALAQVQFPWRLLAIADFVAITAVVMGRPGTRNIVFLAGLSCMAFGLMLVIGVAGLNIQRTWAEGGKTTRSILGQMREAPEYLPRGTDLALDKWKRAVPADIMLPAVPDAKADAPEAQVRATDRPDGGMEVFVASPSATTIVVRRFSFPHWTLTRNGYLEPIGRQGNLVAWRAAAGRGIYRLAPAHLPVERIGWGVSLASVLILLATALALRKRSPAGGRDGRAPRAA